ncbi:IclR family transcriptional regulator [Rhodococcus qingshengii]|uniref:IclR family transcriptional regulator n=1 Tax=Rhodococcus qingshengii TaxID=334542 RepID=UPI0021BAA8DF|nr:IclR family transcriptional regulator [Rhodococcus qingshengii]UXF67276.1 IclR family transcriptional regulator [Rhodococcus qingshengii]
MSGNNASSTKTVLSKATRILDAFGGNRVSMSLSDIVRATGLAHATVHRLAAELVTWGGLERTEDGNFSVGLHLWELGARSRRSCDLKESAMPYLQDLFESTHQHVQLALIDGNEALLIEKVSGPQAVHTVGRVGGRLPLHASAVGKALLAAATPDFQTDYLAHRLTAYTPHTLTSSRALALDLAVTRERGFAVTIEELTVGVVSCASVIAGPGYSALGALSVVTPAGTGHPRRWSQAVTATASAIAGAMAHPRVIPAISARAPWSSADLSEQTGMANKVS